MGPAFQGGRDHVVDQTRGGREPIVEVPEVADSQEKDADISVVTSENELSPALTQITFVGYLIKINRNFSIDQLEVRPTSAKDHLRLKVGDKTGPYPKRIDSREQYILHSAGIVIK